MKEYLTKEMDAKVLAEVTKVHGKKEKWCFVPLDIREQLKEKFKEADREHDDHFYKFKKGNKEGREVEDHRNLWSQAWEEFQAIPKKARYDSLILGKKG